MLFKAVITTPWIILFLIFQPPKNKHSHTSMHVDLNEMNHVKQVKYGKYFFISFIKLKLPDMC